MNEYGRSIEKPLELNGTEFNIIMLKSIVTVNGFHILYHFIDSISYGDSTIKKYEVFSEDYGLQELFFEETNKPNLWIAPSGFLFADEFIIEEDIIYHGSDYFYKDEKDYEEMLNKFDMLEVTNFELFVFENVGVNYNSPDFPYSMYQKYIEEHTYSEGE
jgi:hypothetical protein